MGPIAQHERRMPPPLPPHLSHIQPKPVPVQPHLLPRPLPPPSFLHPPRLRNQSTPPGIRVRVEEGYPVEEKARERLGDREEEEYEGLPREEGGEVEGEGYAGFAGGADSEEATDGGVGSTDVGAAC